MFRRKKLVETQQEMVGVYRYCPMCGNELIEEYSVGNSYPRCPIGHYTYYPSQSVGAAAIIDDKGKIILEKRAIEPVGFWVLPGGMAEQGKDNEQHC
jgi:NADH pyrophosphatase NudC (nudix superfamily)